MNESSERQPATRNSQRPWANRFHSGYRILRSVDLVLYGAAFMVFALGWGFVELAEATQEQEFVGLDRDLMLALRQPGNPHVAVGPAWLAEGWRDITALGSVTLVTLTTCAVVGYLLLTRLWRTAFVVALAACGAGVLSTVLKNVFQRPRPDVVLHFVEVTSPSFPSGHTLVAAVMYPTLGALLAGVVSTARLKLYVLCLALLASLLVGFSRVFLGVHYPSDVAAGLAVGFGWSLICFVVQRLLQRRGTLQRRPATEELLPE